MSGSWSRCHYPSWYRPYAGESVARTPWQQRHRNDLPPRSQTCIPPPCRARVASRDRDCGKWGPAPRRSGLRMLVLRQKRIAPETLVTNAGQHRATRRTMSRWIVLDCGVPRISIDHIRAVCVLEWWRSHQDGRPIGGVGIRTDVGQDFVPTPPHPAARTVSPAGASRSRPAGSDTCPRRSGGSLNHVQAVHRVQNHRLFRPLRSPSSTT